MLCAGELLIGVAIPHKAVTGRQALCHKALAHLSDQVQLRAGDHSAGLIHHTDHTIDGIFHLVDHALKYSIGHKWIPLFLFCASRRGEIVVFNNFAALHYLFYTKRIYFLQHISPKYFFDFLGEIIFQGYFQAQKALFCVVLVNILPAKCDVFLKIR